MNHTVTVRGNVTGMAPIVLYHSMAMRQKHLPPFDVSVRLESAFPGAS